MIEIRFHGRGGQGAVVASELLAQAAFLDGRMPQSFPFFGVERRGAPVTAYARIDERPIGLRTSITAPDVVVVLDPGLLRSTPVTDGLKEGGTLLVNTRAPPESLDMPVRGVRATVDANRIAIANGLGSPTQPIVNTVVLGALARMTGVVSLAAVLRAIRGFVPAHPEANVEAATQGYREVSRAVGLPPTGPAPRPSPRPPTPLPDGPLAAVPSNVLRTAGWRTLKPTIRREECTRCNFCWKYCPDAAISFDVEGFPVVQEGVCKGCGICAAECPPRAIEMVAEG